MPKPPTNPNGVKKMLGYRIDPDLHAWLTNNGKTRTLERIVREEIARLDKAEIEVETPEIEDEVSEFDAYY